MKRYLIALLALLIRVAGEAQEIGPLALEGRIAGEHLTMEMRFAVKDLAAGAPLSVLDGNVAVLECDLPAGVSLDPEGLKHRLVFKGDFWHRKTAGDVRIKFALLQRTEGDKQSVSFSVPVTSTRRLSIACDREGLDVEMPCAKDVVREKAADGSDRVSGYLGFSPEVSLSWKTAVRRLEAELIASCEAATLVAVSPGTVRMRTVLSYRVAQGELTSMTIDMPGVNVIQVTGADLREWRMDKSDPARPRLQIALGRPQRETYPLTVEYECTIPAFPCEFKLESPVPQGVIRSAGTMLLGTDSAVRLQVASLAGLTQIDPGLFSRQTFGSLPARSVYTYQYAAMPYSLTLKAEDIVTALTSDIGVLCNVDDGALTVEANVQLDVRDAPLREVRLTTDADASWTVAAVTGAQVAENDVDIRTVAGGRELVVPFRKPAEGCVVMTLRLERSLGAGSESFAVPSFTVPDAKAQRGYVVAAATRGIRLAAKTAQGLTEVHTASTPLRTEGAQLAYRFREPGWSLELAIERAKASIHAELFHLISLGEGVVYVSTAVTCHISGAPVQSLAFRVPASIAAFDVTGANIDTWKRESDVCTVRLMSRVIGDYTLLITYDRPLNYRGGDLQIGEIEMIETESEMGFVAVATGASLKLEEGCNMPQTLIRIGRDEIPPGYAATVTAPIIGAYKYVRQPHAATLKVTPYATEGLIGQVADYLSLSTKIARNGESVTKAVYSVKNAVRQYLSLKLPADAVLWSVRQMPDDNGAGRELSAQQADGRLLVPVERPRDPNRAVTIEVTYALKGAKGSRTAKLEAPVLAEAPVTFASWVVEAGDKVGINRAEGNLTPDLVKTAWRLPVYNRETARSRRFYRTANLAGEAPLQLTVTLIPAWLSGGSLGVIVCGTALGFGLLLMSLFLRKKVWVALALTSLGMAAAQTECGWLAARLAALVLPVLAVIVGIGRVVRRSRRHKRQSIRETVDGELPLVAEAPPSGDAGFARPGALFVAAAAIAVVAVITHGQTNVQESAQKAVSVAPEAACAFANGASGIRIRSERTAVEISARNESGFYVAAVKRSIDFEAERSGVFRFLKSDDATQPALVSFADHRLARVAVDGAGAVLKVDRPGSYVLSYETRETAQENAVGPTGFTWASFGGLKSQVEILLPSAELDVSGINIAQFTSAPEGGKSRVTGVLTTGTRRFGVSFRPRVRDSRKEAAVVYCDVSTLAFLRSGVVDVKAWAVYTVAQGEVRELRLKVPAGMVVVSVTAQGLATWSLEPVSRLLTAVFEKPQVGAVTLAVGLQCACGGLPYTAELGVLSAEGVQRQRGYFAVSAAETVLMKSEKEAGVTAINVSDFSCPDAQAAQNKDEPVRRAYRYDEAAAVKVALRAEAVLPEIRVQESSSFSIGDERYVLGAKLEVTIAKAGVFAFRIEPPQGYEIETLTGSGVSHWDDSRKGGGAVDVFLTSRLLGSTTLNLVLARQQRGIEEKIAVPSVTVHGALRHTGRMAVSAERGVRLTLESQQGVSVVRDDEIRTSAGTVVFDILRPAWSVELKTLVMQPVLKPELLHRVDLMEGMLQHRVYARYKIENAGVKVFRVAVPVKDATLTVSGKSIARVRPEASAAPDGTRVWVIELHGKVEDSYAFTALYQEPYDPAAGGVVIRPFGTPDVVRQTAWLAITGGGRVQVEPRGEVTGLRPEDARSLPDRFGAGDLSGAIRCYRVLQPDYTLDLSVTRHEAARVLPAGVENARLTTVLSASGKMLTQAIIQLRTGRLRFLKVGLPKSGELWAAQVNGTEVAVARDSDGNLNVPLELLATEQATTITLVYADGLSGAPAGVIEVAAPRLPELPLQDVSWTLFVPPGARYRLANTDFDDADAFHLASGGVERVKTFGRAEYMNFNKEQGWKSLSEAKRSLGNVGALLDKGDRMMAQKTLQQAVKLSQAEQTLNEDARVQFRNVVQEQVKIGLVNRREALRMDNNIFDERAPQTQAGYNGGNFSREFATRVEEQLTAQDRASLDRVASKIVEQQAAAAGQGAAINIAMPEHGRVRHFTRALQNECGGSLVLALRVAPENAIQKALAWWVAIPVFSGLWLLLCIAFGSAKRRTPRPSLD